MSATALMQLLPLLSGSGGGSGGDGGSGISSLINNLPTIGGIARGVYGGIQLLGNKRPEDFEYNIPDEVSEMVAMARKRLENPLPGADLQRERIEQSTARGIASAERLGGASGSAIGLASEMLGKELEGMNNLAIQESQAQLQAEKALTDQLGTSAQYTDRAFDLNVRRPYEQALAEFFSRRQQGEANLFGGMSDVGYAGQQQTYNKMLMEELGK